MDALRARGADAHADGAKLVTDALVAARARAGGGDRETLLAVRGRPPGGWRPPVYRRNAPAEVPSTPRQSQERRIAASLGIDETERAAREGLDEESLVVFDILVELKSDTLDGAARTRVKKVARALLDAVNQEIGRGNLTSQQHKIEAQEVAIDDAQFLDALMRVPQQIRFMARQSRRSAYPARWKATRSCGPECN